MNKIKYVAVVFGKRNPDPFEYKTDLDLEVGNKIVCDGGGSLIVGEVVEVREIPKFNDYHKWVIQKVDLTKYMERVNAEAERAQLEAAMEVRKQELAKQNEFEFLAGKDPVMAKMLARYKELDI